MLQNSPPTQPLRLLVTEPNDAIRASLARHMQAGTLPGATPTPAGGAVRRRQSLTSSRRLLLMIFASVHLSTSACFCFFLSACLCLGVCVPAFLSLYMFVSVGLLRPSLVFNALVLTDLPPRTRTPFPSPATVALISIILITSSPPVHPLPCSVPWHGARHRRRWPLLPPRPWCPVDLGAKSCVS